MLLGEHLGEVLMVEPRVGRLGQADDPLPDGGGEAVAGGAAAVAMGQGGGPPASVGGEEALAVSQGNAQERSSLGHSQTAFEHGGEGDRTALLVAVQRHRLLGHEARVTESLNS